MMKKYKKPVGGVYACKGLYKYVFMTDLGL